MTGSAQLSWALDARSSSADIVAALAAGFSVQLDQVATSTARYYDDADARLWRSNLLLSESDGRTFRLERDGVLVDEARAPAGARFWWDFPTGPLQHLLQRLCGVRALMPVVARQIDDAELTLRNGDEKIVVRGQLQRSTVAEQSLQYLTLTPLRGYQAEFAAAIACIQPFVRGAADLGVQAILTRHGVPGFAPRRALAMPITESMPTEQAVRVMAHMMLEGAQQHVEGVVADVDSEFLHAYRVKLRKARSLLSLLKKSLPGPMLEKLKPRLSAMAGATNTLRDLDVYLLAQHDYRALLPAGFESGMDALAERIRRQRIDEQQRVSAHLSSPGYQADVDACLAELSLQPTLATPLAAQPVLNLVKRQLRKRYAAICAQAQAIEHDCADDELHALRIEFKKLRYLIEFFADLLPRKRIARMLDDLKQIQGVLGDFNDFSVQIGFLTGFLDDEQIEMSRALSGLIAVLHVKKLAARERIFAAIAGYFTETRAIEFELVFNTRKLEKSS